MITSTTERLPNATVTHSECLVLHPRYFVPWKETDSVVSFQPRELVRDVKDLVILPIMFLIGGPANVINMAVFHKQGLKERINACLFALSLSDGLHLVTYMIMYGERLSARFVKDVYGPIFTWIVNNNFQGFYAFAWVSQVLTAIVASERCFCDLRPLKSQTILRTSTMIAIIVVVFAVVLGLRFVVTTRFYITCAYNPVSGSTIMIARMRDFYTRHQKLVDVLDIVMYGVGLPWMVIAVVVTSTVITVIKLRQAAKWRADSASRSGRMSVQDIGVTRMLVGNSIFFIICVFPFGLLRLALLFMPEMKVDRRYHNLFATGILLLDIFSYINATFNIIIYFAMGSRYRQTFWTLLGRRSTNDTPRNKAHP